MHGDDGSRKSMHFFISKDLGDVKCKHPQEDFIKQKWIIPVHQIRDVIYGYNSDSPIAKRKSLFVKKCIPKDRCFAIYGPIMFDGPRNIHIECQGSTEAKMWFNKLQLLVKEYKKV